MIIEEWLTRKKSIKYIWSFRKKGETKEKTGRAGRKKCPNGSDER